MPPGAKGIEHIFVLMLENRSFDHMLGFSGITGTDAATGASTTINGLNGAEANTFNGQSYAVSQGAHTTMPADPAHEFLDVLHQLCGPAAGYPPGGSYPPIDNSGFVASYAASGGGSNPGEVMKCYGPNQLPVLNALAREFVVCDRWHASMPGATWPNRMFVHAASAGGLDHSPTTFEIAQWEAIAGFSFANGTIFDALQKKKVKRRLYGGDAFPMVSALKGIQLPDIRSYGLFAADLHKTFPYSYIFIEPSYDVLHDYRSGTSQHPLGDVTQGEGLIKATYEAIRNSPVWPKSMLIVTWDEHGGFYDHVAPPAAPPPGDTVPGNSHSRYGFPFDRYGLRVPAVVVSPLIPKNRIDHRLYDHASIPATVEAFFGLPAMTKRDGQANRLDALVTLAAPRADTPEALPTPAVNAAPAVNPGDTVNQGTVPSVLHAALHQHLELEPQNRAEILTRFTAIQTREQALQYMAEVQQKVRQHTFGK